MKMRTGLIAAVMVSVLAASEGRHVCVTAIGRSAHAFSEYFQALRAEPLNPVERVVFSLVLARSQAQRECRLPRHS